MLKNKEIGSEFWLENNPDNLILGRDGLYVLSGRTAIDIIVQDIKSSRQIKSVYLPAYCCDSMIFPFTRKGIEIKLYDISFDEKLHYHIDDDFSCDIFYVTNYFGYTNTLNNSIIEHFKENGSIIVYDKTHSFFMNGDNANCDYSLASIRKWLGVIDGAVVNGIKEDFVLKDCPYIECKEQAMKEKMLYIYGDTSISKNSFLQKYSEFNHKLTKDYSDYKMDNLSYTIYKNTNLIELINTRRNNAKYLHENLENVFFLSEFTDESCPLFVPIIFNTTEERDCVRKILIENQIYCPIHWQKNGLVTSEMKVNDIFDRELSLICDQRYNIDDMNRIVNIINMITK